MRWYPTEAMEEKQTKLKVDRQTKISYWISTAVLGVASFCLIFFLSVDYSHPWNPEIWSNACFATFAIIAFWGLFTFVRRRGTFDVLAYGMMRFFQVWRKVDERKYESASDYHQQKMVERHGKKTYYLPMIIIGGAFLAAAIVATIFFYVR